MTIEEASELVIQAGSLSKGGDVFVLEMGRPVNILSLAKQMIELSGYDIKDSSNPLAKGLLESLISYPDNSIICLARLNILTGRPISNTKTSPPLLNEPA